MGTLSACQNRSHYDHWDYSIRKQTRGHRRFLVPKYAMYDIELYVRTVYRGVYTGCIIDHSVVLVSLIVHLDNCLVIITIIIITSVLLLTNRV